MEKNGGEIEDVKVENYKVLEAGKVPESGSNTNPTFATEDKLISHFEKHGGKFKGMFNTADGYLQGAQDVM